MRLGASKDANVQKIQTALNNVWKSHKYYPLAVDGYLGKKTCWTCYDYQKNSLGITSVRLTPQFFTSFGWDGQSWYENYGRVCEPYHTSADDLAGGTGSGISTGGDDNVRQIQTALNYAWKGHKFYPLAVDGKFGPNTCYAAFDYQTRGLGVGGSNLTPQFFASFGWDGNVWASQYGGGCAAYYSAYDGGASGGDTPVADKDGSGGGGGTPVKKEEPPPVPPLPEVKPFPWLAMLVGAGGGALIGLAGKKTVLKKQKRIKPAYAALGGAALGAVGGLIVGKMRQ
jgi:hypothetical protein